MHYPRAPGPYAKRAERMKLFVLEYRKDFNASRAAIAVGYAKGRAKQRGCELLQREDVQTLLREAQERVLATARKTEDDILRELEHVAFLDIGEAFGETGDLLPMVEVNGKRMPERVRRAISGMDVEELFEGSGDERRQSGIVRKVKLSDKLRALEMYGKHIGMFKTDVRLSADQSFADLILAAQRKREASKSAK